MTSTIYLSLGSNLGDRLKNLGEAKTFLSNYEISILKSSSIYETEPIAPLLEDKNQPWFLNQIVCAKTILEPFALLSITQQIERDLGRNQKTTFQNGLRHYVPRPIDIDLLLYDNLVIETPDLQIPHPRFHNRRYDLVPLAEIAPNFQHPIFKQPIHELLKNCTDIAKVVANNHWPLLPNL